MTLPELEDERAGTGVDAEKTKIQEPTDIGDWYLKTRSMLKKRVAGPDPR